MKIAQSADFGSLVARQSSLAGSFDHSPSGACSSGISIPASFGRVLVVDRVSGQDLKIWAEGFKDAANDHRYYDLTHDALQDQFCHYYLLLKDSSDTTRAIQPLFVVKQDIMLGMPDWVTRFLDRIRRRYPSLMKLPVLMIGCSAGEGRLAGATDGLGDQWTVKALAEILPLVAKSLKTELIVFKDFPKADRPKFDRLKESGFGRISSMPATKLELNYKSFDHYLETALSAKMRKDLRRKFRKAATGAPITMEVVQDISPFIDEAFPLYEQVLRKSKLKFEVLTKSYFIDLGKSMPDKAKFLIWRQEGRMVAFNACIAHEGVLRDYYIGFDYTVALDYHLYFVSRRDLFSWAIEQGYHTYYSAPLNYDPKLHLRQQLAPLDLYVRTSRAWLNPLFRLFLPLMDPTRYDPIIKKFANAHELT